MICQMTCLYESQVPIVHGYEVASIDVSKLCDISMMSIIGAPFWLNANVWLNLAYLFLFTPSYFPSLMLTCSRLWPWCSSIISLFLLFSSIQSCPQLNPKVWNGINMSSSFFFISRNVSPYLRITMAQISEQEYTYRWVK